MDDSKKPRRAKPKVIEPQVVAEVKRLMDKKGLKIYPLAKALGITGSHFHRMLNLKRGWSIDDLATVADALDVTLGHFFAMAKIPIISRIGGENYPAASQGGGMEYIVMPEFSGLKVSECTCIILEDDRFSGWGLTRCTKILVAENQPIKENDFVFYTDQSGSEIFGRYQPHNGGIAIKSLNAYGTPREIVIHASHKKLLQKRVATFDL